jgi:WD40 repeat protein
LAWRYADGGRSIFTVDSGGLIERWGGEAFSQQSAVMETEKIADSWRVTFAADCALLAIGAKNGLLHVWDWERRTQLHEFKTSGDTGGPKFAGRGTNVLVEVYPPDSKAVRVHEWDLRTGKETRSWPSPHEWFNWTIASDEKRLLIVGWEGETSLVDLASGEVRNVRLNLREPQPMSFSPDGRMIALPSQRGFARLLDATTLREIATLSGFMLGVHSAVFSPDGTRLATGSNGGEAIKLWDVASHHNLVTLEGQGSLIWRVGFSPDGDTLAAQSGRGVLNLWHAPSWAEIAAAEKVERKGP